MIVGSYLSCILSKNTLTTPITTILVLVVSFEYCPAQPNKLLYLEDVLNTHYLTSNDAKLLRLQIIEESLNVENFRLKSLPNISLDINPTSFSQSIISLQDPASGNFNYTNSFVNNSNVGIGFSQPLNLTGGQFQLNSSINMMNEFSLDRNTFSSVPIKLSYRQPFIGGAKIYKLDKEVNRLREKNLSGSSKHGHYSVQQHCVELYMMVLVYDLLLKNSRINLHIADTIHSISQVKQSVGDITEQDFLQSEIQYEQSKTDVVNREIQYDKALRELLTYLNLEYANYAVVMPQYDFSPNIDINRAISDVNVNNPQFRNSQIIKAEAERNLYNVKLQGVFNGDVSISFGLNQYSDQLFMAYKKPSTQQSIMIGFRIPIIDWGVQKNNNAIAKSRYESSLLEADNSEKKIYELLRSTVEDYNYSVRVRYL